MKNIFMLILLFSFSSLSFSQSDSLKENKNNHKNKWDCSVSINSVEAQFGNAEESAWAYNNLYDSKEKDKSFSLNIIPGYFIKKDLLIRFEFGITNIHFTRNSNSKSNIPTIGNYLITNVVNEQKIYRCVPGMQWNFFKAKSIETYCGLNVPYIRYGKEKYNSNNEIRNSATDTLNYSTIIIGAIPGGFALGGGFFTGVNIYLHKNFTIGAEFSIALQYYNIGGDLTGTLITQSPPNQPITSELKQVGFSYTGITFSKIVPSFNVRILF